MIDDFRDVTKYDKNEYIQLRIFVSQLSTFIITTQVTTGYRKNRGVCYRQCFFSLSRKAHSEPREFNKIFYIREPSNIKRKPFADKCVDKFQNYCGGRFTSGFCIPRLVRFFPFPTFSFCLINSTKGKIYLAPPGIQMYLNFALLFSYFI